MAELELLSHGPGLSLLGCAASLNSAPLSLGSGYSSSLFCTFPSLMGNQDLFSFPLYQ